MQHRKGRSDLVLEAQRRAQPHLVARIRRVEDLERDSELAQGEVPAEVHDAHPPRAQAAHDPIPPGDAAARIEFKYISRIRRLHLPHASPPVLPAPQAQKARRAV